MEDKYCDIAITNLGELIIKENASGNWEDQIYTSNKHGGCTGTHCEIRNLEESKNKLINKLLEDAKKEIKNIQLKINKFENLLKQ